jgi:hypothetical protein
MLTTVILGNIISYLVEVWGQLPDHRKPNNNRRYETRDGVLSAFAVFFMQSPSFLAHQRTMQGVRGRSNAQSLFQIEQIPSDTQIRNLLDPLRPSDFEPAFEWLFKQLAQSGGLDAFRDYHQTFLVALDGVVYFSSEKISCAHCSQRTDRAGQVHFYHSALTPVIVKPQMSQVLPLAPEFMKPQDGHDKQDCEQQAVKRWLGKHGSRLPPFSHTYLADDLFSHQPICQQIVDQQQYFLFVCKPDSHANLYEWVTMLDKADSLASHVVRHWNGTHGEIWRYRFTHQIPIRAGAAALPVNWFELTIAHEQTGAVLYHNAFITNHAISSSVVGRTRWKVENEHHNVLKNRGYHFEHNFGHGHQQLASVLCTLNLLAFLIHTILHLVDQLYRRLRDTLAVRQTFFNDLRALTRYMLFDSWLALFTFMADGLELPRPPPLPS